MVRRRKSSRLILFEPPQQQQDTILMTGSRKKFVVSFRRKNKKKRNYYQKKPRFSLQLQALQQAVKEEQKYQLIQIRHRMLSFVIPADWTCISSILSGRKETCSSCDGSLNENSCTSSRSNSKSESL